ncbi:hypothetical protein [Luteimonas sp. 3794]|uniref:hypothetical protein n=1 Tax=Luteimonas sp. 3794 TaxID=2817730 RepID=UPI002859BCF8|nr:hypothetical protein [Luteimonas sp. 3794]MDR6991049.1 hypothetical protein [Luteimonas sp. 3794]
MTSTDRPPLTPEERLLADRLTRDGGAVSPSAALDAAILGAAREAADAGAPQPHVAVAHRRTPPRRRGWPFAAGIAASLALAVGIAWQLRPAPETEMRAASERPDVAASDTAPAPEVLRSHEEAAPGPMQAPSPAPANPRVPAADANASVDEAPRPAARQREAVAVESVEATSTPAPANAQQQAERGTAFGADVHAASAAPPATPAAAPAPSAPAPARPPAPPAPPAPMQAPAAEATARSAAAPAASAAMQQRRAESQALMLDTIDDVPDDGDPPASADAPEVRAAWLARVRELLDAGRIAEAKASLAEFHRRHPQAELPPDLRALLD